MKDTKILEQNVKNSFHFVKDDVFMLEQEHKLALQRIAHLEKNQKRLLFMLAEQQKAQQQFIGNIKTGDLHKEDCILARSSSSGSVMVFRSLREGHRQGFIDCICLS